MIDMRIDISRIKEMIEEIIWTMSEMVIGVMTATIQEGMTIVNQSIVEIIGTTMTVSIHLTKKIVYSNRTREVVNKKIGGPIILGGKMIITKEIHDSMITRTQKGINNFDMNLEKGICQILRILAGNKVKPVLLPYRIATNAEKMIIM